MLMAAGIAQISPLLIMEYLYYPLILGVCSILAIALAPEKRESAGKAEGAIRKKGRQSRPFCYRHVILVILMLLNIWGSYVIIYA